MLEYFLQCCPKDRTKKSLQRVDLLHIKLELLGLKYQTPFIPTVSQNTKKIAIKSTFRLITLAIFKQY
jgi:hypothetical protein